MMENINKNINILNINFKSTWNETCLLLGKFFMNITINIANTF